MASEKHIAVGEIALSLNSPEAYINPGQVVLGTSTDEVLTFGKTVAVQQKSDMGGLVAYTWFGRLVLAKRAADKGKKGGSAESAIEAAKRHKDLRV